MSNGLSVAKLPFLRETRRGLLVNGFGKVRPIFRSKFVQNFVEFSLDKSDFIDSNEGMKRLKKLLREYEVVLVLIGPFSYLIWFSITRRPDFWGVIGLLLLLLYFCIKHAPTEEEVQARIRALESGDAAAGAGGDGGCAGGGCL